MMLLRWMHMSSSSLSMTARYGTKGCFIKAQAVAINFNVIDDAIAAEKAPNASAASGSHSGGIEDGGGITAV